MLELSTSDAMLYLMKERALLIGAFIFSLSVVGTLPKQEISGLIDTVAFYMVIEVAEKSNKKQVQQPCGWKQLRFLIQMSRLAVRYRFLLKTAGGTVGNAYYQNTVAQGSLLLPSQQ
jgi:hypothetical protein